MPDGYGSNAEALLKQCSLYLNTGRRLELAKQMEIAGLHNMRSNIRYYHKKNPQVALELIEQELSNFICMINEGKTVEELMLIEARARQRYYGAFNDILHQDGFVFEKRTKQPPADPINALISFGNTLLYNQFLQMIWKNSLDPRIGVIHATNKRSYSLNLDFADIYKPVIVDRVIFALVNLHQIKAGEDFEQKDTGGIYLNKKGKRLFLEQFEEKLADHLTIKGKEYTYRQLMEDEVRRFQKYMLKEEKYKPYKYY